MAAVAPQDWSGHDLQGWHANFLSARRVSGTRAMDTDKRHQKFPALTVIVLAVTAAFAVTQLIVPALPEWLGRDPKMLGAGEYWRFFTALLVQSDGWPQMAVNLPALVIVGAMVERRWSRAAWMAAYLVGGLTGELFGIVWQPVGGGNSVAIAGLLGLLLIGLPRERKLPRVVRLVWPIIGLCGAIYLSVQADIHGPPLAAGALVGLLAIRMSPDTEKH